MYLKIIDFAKYTSLKIGSKLPVWILEKSDEVAFSALDSKQIWEELDKIQNNFIASKDVAYKKSSINLPNLAKALAKSHTKPFTKTQDFSTQKPSCFTCIGNGYNLLVSPNAKRLTMLSSEFDYISQKEKNIIEVGGKTSSSALFRFCKEQNLGGLEFLKALPGSVGGLVKMNAGMKQYEIKNTLLEVCVNGIWREDFTLSYRTSDISGIISAARFSLKNGFDSALLEQFQAMRKSHPKEPSCGSCFKNPNGDYAGRLLEAVGLKGVRQNGVGFSPIHANFLVNFSHKLEGDCAKNASFTDALAMITHAQNLVQSKFNIELIPEVQIIT